VQILRLGTAGETSRGWVQATPPVNIFQKQFVKIGENSCQAIPFCLLVPKIFCIRFVSSCDRTEK